MSPFVRVLLALLALVFGLSIASLVIYVHILRMRVNDQLYARLKQRAQRARSGRGSRPAGSG